MQATAKRLLEATTKKLLSAAVCLTLLGGCTNQNGCTPAPQFGAMSDQPVGGPYGTERRGDDPQGMDGGPITQSQRCQIF